MRSDNLSYFGETEIRLYGIDYPMKFDISTLQQWEKATDKDFAHVSMQCVLLWSNMLQERLVNEQQGKDIGVNLAEEAEKLTGIVSREDAAQLFYYGARASNSQVTFEEIQEGVMRDGPYRRLIKDERPPDHGEYTESYPVLFISVILALQGAYDNIKKKPPTPAISSAL